MDKLLAERYALSSERVKEIMNEKEVREPYLDFFRKTAAFLSKTVQVMNEDKAGLTLEEWKNLNDELYEDILPKNYKNSYGNPAYACEKLGGYGKAFTFLYAELRGAVVFSHEKRMWDMTVLLELFLEVYSAFAQEELPAEAELRGILSSYINDYCQDMIEERTRASVDPQVDFALRIIMDSDLTDLRYLYKYGEYVTENELGAAAFLNGLSQDEIDACARTYTEGFRMGFVNGRKDLSKKKTVNIRYNLGFERMVKAAVYQFEEMGLKPVIFRYGVHTVNKRGMLRIGYTGAVANPQFDYDHRQDSALYMDADFVQRRLRALQISYEKYKDLAAVHAGPACIEVFGEAPFSPAGTREAWEYSELQQKLELEMSNEAGQITNRYIKGDERSFTIIAYPVPEIGGNYQEIFREIVRINTLDYQLYQKIQQTIIDALDTGKWVFVKGKGNNVTDLKIHLHTLEDPEKQSNFENCVADVNIPVGEVFTSPVLSGTNGVLHVSKVYLNGLQFCDLKLEFKDGKITAYSCGNFETEEENKKYIEDNILHHHPTLPMGEFAIGTNTTAYVAAKKYSIADKLPILIAEKMGPHFAVGDTCYSWSEDTPVFNPDGKEIIARDNEVSILRKEDISKAYLGCHTDITIPYDELGSIRVIGSGEKEISIIEDGRFVLAGTEELNKPFED